MAYKVRIIMTDNGAPYENALTERMNRAIKEEMLQGRNLVEHRRAVAEVADTSGA
ncbi:MAG: transposase [Bacteroidetes bacterium]|nr:transposase [Bacteroidota bacterium]